MNTDEHDPFDEGVSEFGARLADLLREVPTAHGAVITDDGGDAIDWARRIGSIGALDVQLLGAQIGLTLSRLDTGWRGLGHGVPTLTVWADAAVLLARPILHDYLLAVRVDAGSDYAQLGTAFDRAAADIRALIG